VMGSGTPLLHLGSNLPFNPLPASCGQHQGRGQLPVHLHLLIPRLGGATHRSAPCTPSPATSGPALRRASLGSSGSSCPCCRHSAGGGESFLCLLRLLPASPLSCGPAPRGCQGGPHSGHWAPQQARSPFTHCSGRRPAGPAPWPPSGLHQDPRPLRPRRPGPGAAGAHLRRTHDAAAILVASSSPAAPAATTAAAAAAAALCSARRGRAGLGGEGTAARAGAGPGEPRGGTRGCERGREST
jgi:hypothetical protein